MITSITAASHTHLPFIALAEAPKTSTCRKVMLVFSMFLAAAAVAAAFVLHLIAGAVALVPAAFAIRAAYKALSIKPTPITFATTENEELNKALGGEKYCWNNDHTKQLKQETRSVEEIINLTVEDVKRSGRIFPIRAYLPDNRPFLVFTLDMVAANGKRQASNVMLLADGAKADAKWAFVKPESDLQGLIQDLAQCATQGVMRALVCPLLAARGEAIVFKGKTKEWKLALNLPITPASYANLPMCPQTYSFDRLEWMPSSEIKGNRIQGKLDDGRIFVGIRHYTESWKGTQEKWEKLLKSKEIPTDSAGWEAWAADSKVSGRSERIIFAVMEGGDWSRWKLVPNRSVKEDFFDLWNGKSVVWHMPARNYLSVCLPFDLRADLIDRKGRKVDSDLELVGVQQNSLTLDNQPITLKEIDDILEASDPNYGEMRCANIQTKEEQEAAKCSDTQAFYRNRAFNNTEAFSFRFAIVAQEPIGEPHFGIIGCDLQKVAGTGKVQTASSFPDLLKTFLLATGAPEWMEEEERRLAWGERVLKVLNTLLHAKDRTHTFVGTDGIRWTLKLGAKTHSIDDLNAFITTRRSAS
jgi:hypothetical protein